MTNEQILKLFNTYSRMFPGRKESFSPTTANVARWQKDIREEMAKQLEKHEQLFNQTDSDDE